MRARSSAGQSRSRAGGSGRGRGQGAYGARTRASAAAPAVRRRRFSLRGARRRRYRALLITVALLTSLVLALIAGMLVSYASYRSQLPDAATVAAMEPPLDTHVYDSKGGLIAVFNDSDFRHQHVALADISAWAKTATIDVEDRHFYGEGSWDLPRLVKAGWDNLRHTGQTQGASTITEQLAKISFFNSPQRSLDYKVKEIVLGNELDANLTKDQILEMYLNRVPYGNHAIGIGTASMLYFQIPAAKLDLAQASLLAGLPQSPSAYDPTRHDAATTINPAAKDRQRTVLQAMVSNGDISQQQADDAFNEPLTVHSWTESNPNPHRNFTDYVQRWLVSQFGDSYIRPGGWDIYTTLDPAKQAIAETTLHDGIAKLRATHNGKDGAIVNIEPKTGRVVAMVGTWDYSDPEIGQINMALTARSPGSTIKLFTYTAAIASRMFTVESPVVDAPITLYPGPGQPAYSPLDYDRRWHGTCVIKTCLGNSLNVPAVKVEAAVGIPYITNLEIAAGLTSLKNPANRPGPRQYAATLGGLTYGLTPLELADGAATIADLGVHHDPSPVDRIVESGSGRILYRLNPETTAHRVVPENAAFIINEVTSNDNNRVNEFGSHGDLTLPDRRASAKTGTAEQFLDNWTVGWTPELVTTVWVGNPSPSCLKSSDRAVMQNYILRGRVLYSGMTVNDPFSPADLAQYGLQPKNNSCGHLDNSSGITGAAPIWHQDMIAALKGTKPTWYTRPKDVVATGNTDDADFFLPGTAPRPTPCYYYAPSPAPAASPQPCAYAGTSQPSSPPTAAPSATPSAAATPAPPGG